MSSSTSSVPRPRVLADVLPGAAVRDVALVLGYAVAIGLGAQLRLAVPGTPVPITAQTFVVLLGAAALGARRAGAGALVYAVLGFVGLPWFAVSSGATLGYVAGFAVAAAVVGRAADRDRLRAPAVSVAVMAAASLVVYALGASVLAVVTGMGPRAAIAAGVLPFLAGDAVKVLAAGLLMPAATRWVGRFASED